MQIAHMCCAVGIYNMKNKVPAHKGVISATRNMCKGCWIFSLFVVALCGIVVITEILRMLSLLACKKQSKDVYCLKASSSQ